MITTPYKTLTGFESLGSIGSLGVRIEVAGSNLPDLEIDDIRDAGYKAMDSIKEAITAAIMAADPKAQERAKEEREEILGCFDGPIYVEEIPNGYGKQGCCRHLPWFVVTTAVGRIKIGWRKRVIEIDWSETKGTAEAETLFAAEDVTKGTRYIHAWSVKKAKSYVAAIMSSRVNTGV